MSSSNAAAVAASRAFESRNISLSQRAPVTMINLRGAGSDPVFVAQAGRVIGLPLPVTSNTFLAAPGLHCVWQGPDDWLIMDAVREAESLAHQLDDALVDFHHAVTDVSGNRVTLRLSGNAAIELLSVGCPLDLDRRVFKPGMAVQTVLARTTVTLMNIDGTTFDVLVRRSFGRCVQAWLVNAAGGVC